MLDIEEFEKKIGKKSRLLGIDPGKKRIGVAISDENKIIATPYTTIIKNKFSDLLNNLNNCTSLYFELIVLQIAL